MKKLFAVTAAIALLCLGALAQAITIDTVPVGNPGNAGELSGSGAGGYGPDRVCGSVGYAYNIGKYEVTAGQYTDFLNKVARTDTYGLYNTKMDTAVHEFGCNIKRSGSPGSYTYSVAADWANRPVNFVSYWDSCRFANWLHNGQPTGLQDLTTTEDGTYLINDYNSSDGRTIQRKGGWQWAVTSEDEWYKAAYYKGGSTSAGYWDYPTSSDSMPSNVLGNPTDPGNNATYYNNGYTIGSPYYRTEVGAHENSDSAYATFDQGGNVWEWNEAIVYQGTDYACRGVRGGSFPDPSGYDLQASDRHGYTIPTSEYQDLGFRVSEVVPEPSSFIALAGGLISLLGIRRRRV
ncbi:MAG TPA: SUMF1/EgtB/PvdO family nonheme iron enzyme [Armatimonadota bacterium]|nr:SUMF1/EgtB/PvdO family nonheme iron enzyme [Armatimonadota bacterium]